VLSRFDPDERPEMDDAVRSAAEAVDLFIASGIEPVMNRFNRVGATETDTEESEEGADSV
jgi:peptidyl-tRNA hydrolase